MQNSAKKILFSAFLVLFLAACGGGGSDSGGDTAVTTPEPTPTPAPTPSTKIVAISDSIGTGFGLAEPWPVRIGRMLGAPVSNNSVSGEQTGYGLSIITGLLDSEQPTHVVIMLGTNDAIRGSVSNATNNLQQMVDIANARNVTAIVATLPPITRSSSENSRASQISASIRNLNGATIADVRAAMPNSAIVDGVHPGDSGQQIIADTIAALFSK